MKMPDVIETIMFAPCGMDCMVCYTHCAHKKPCEGCLRGDAGKPEHCRKCKIKDCIAEKGVVYCHECKDYPCKRIKYLEKSYNTRYGASLADNSMFVREHGLEVFMEREKNRFACPACGGVVSIHGGGCSECGSKDQRPAPST